MADSARPPARQPRAKAAARPWQWARTADTQRALLDAAREVFTEQGFTDASIADVVERAGSSVGSLYHHFGGKGELFIALWQEYQHAQEEAASKAVAEAKQADVTDSFELFCAGTRAFLEGCWQRRDLAMLFYDGDGRPASSWSDGSAGMSGSGRTTPCSGCRIPPSTGCTRSS